MERWIQLWYSVRTLVNLTMYPRTMMIWEERKGMQIQVMRNGRAPVLEQNLQELKTNKKCT
jgi:hypothetical protein